MQKALLLSCSIFMAIVQTTSAQDKPEWKQVFSSINKEALDHSRAYETLKEATETIGHRLTGSANGKKAEEYAYNLLKSYGFTNLRYQPFEVESWSREI